MGTFTSAITSGSDLTKITMPGKIHNMKLQWMSRFQCYRKAVNKCAIVHFSIELIIQMTKI
jgi:hypothetical protein